MSVAALALLYCDDPVLAYLAHCVGNQLTYFWVIVGADSSNLLYLVIVVINLLGVGLDVFYNSCYSLVDTTLQVHRIGTCGNVLQAYVDNALCKDGSGCCSVACIVAGLACNALDELCTSILEVVGKLNLLCYGNTVLGYLGSTELLLDDNVAAFRTECNLNCICQLVNALLQQVAGVHIEFNVFSHDVLFFVVEGVAAVKQFHRDYRLAPSCLLCLI